MSYLVPEILARITRLGLRAQRVVEGTISGLHRSPLHGVSVEFADYREYSPGDDLKRLDWALRTRSAALCRQAIRRGIEPARDDPARCQPLDELRPARARDE